MTELELFEKTIAGLEDGSIRSAYKVRGEWVANTEVKQIILSGFRLGKLTGYPVGQMKFSDKDTVLPRFFSPEDGVRIVPGGSSVRRGAYLAPGVVMMPPSYVNIGAYVDEGTMLDSHSLVGSCAQIGKRVHLSAASQIGGVLEPVGALPVIVEDGVFIGGNCGIYEGTVLQEGCVIATGVIINKATAVYDAVNGKYIRAVDGRLTIPAGAVVVSGSRPLKGSNPEGIQIYTPVIVKYRDGRTDASLELENALR